MSVKDDIAALLGNGRKEAAEIQDVCLDAVEVEKVLSFGDEEEERQYPPDNRQFPPEMETEDREPSLDEYGADSQVYCDPEEYSNPPRFVHKRLVHPSVMYDTDMPPLVVHSRGVNRHPQRLAVSELWHPILGKYFNHMRSDLRLNYEVPDWGFDEFCYEYPEIPRIHAGMSEREMTVLMINAYQAAVEYYTKERCTEYTAEMSQAEKKVVLLAARRLRDAGVKPHLWAISYLAILQRAKKSPWVKGRKPPKITRVFNPRSIEERGEEIGNIEMPTPYYETPTASKMRMMTRWLNELLRHMRHYENVTQEDIDILAKRRIRQLHVMRDHVRAEYQERYAFHTQQIKEGRWVWGGSLE